MSTSGAGPAPGASARTDEQLSTGPKQHGYAPADRFAISDRDMMCASVSVTAAIHDLLSSTWTGIGDPLPLTELGTLDPQLRFGGPPVTASTWLGDAWPGYVTSRAEKVRLLTRAGAAWVEHVPALLAALHACAAVPFFHGLPWHDELLDTVAAEHPELTDTVATARATPWRLCDDEAFELRWPLQQHDFEVAAAWADRHGRREQPQLQGLAGLWARRL